MRRFNYSVIVIGMALWLANSSSISAHSDLDTLDTDPVAVEEAADTQLVAAAPDATSAVDPLTMIILGVFGIAFLTGLAFLIVRMRLKHFNY